MFSSWHYPVPPDTPVQDTPSTATLQFRTHPLTFTHSFTSASCHQCHPVWCRVDTHSTSSSIPRLLFWCQFLPFRLGQIVHSQSGGQSPQHSLVEPTLVAVMHSYTARSQFLCSTSSSEVLCDVPTWSVHPPVTTDSINSFSLHSCPRSSPVSLTLPYQCPCSTFLTSIKVYVRDLPCYQLSPHLQLHPTHPNQAGCYKHHQPHCFNTPTFT